VADEGQLIPEDPNCMEQPPAIQKIEAPPVEKRQKMGEVKTEASDYDFGERFKRVFEHDDDDMKEDELCLHEHMVELVNHFESPSAVKFFQSADARAPKSLARNLVESSRRWV